MSFSSSSLGNLILTLTEQPFNDRKLKKRLSERNSLYYSRFLKIPAPLGSIVNLERLVKEYWQLTSLGSKNLSLAYIFQSGLKNSVSSVLVIFPLTLAVSEGESLNSMKILTGGTLLEVSILQ